MRITITILTTIIFTWIGILLLDFTIPIIPFPIVVFLFGISIPIANYDKLKTKKIAKILILGITSSGLIIIGLGLSIWATNFSHNWMPILISGIVGVLHLILYSSFLENIKPNIISYIITFALCAVSLPFGSEIIDSIELLDRDMVILFWATFFSLALISSFRKEKYSC